jgi:ABC-type molybdate transport system ATPase subunit
MFDPIHKHPKMSRRTVGDQIRVRILATDVSLAREPPGRSSILNVLPAQIVAANTLNAYEILAAVALGEDGAGAQLLARVPQKSWEELGFAQGQNVFAQVKSVALGRANMREYEGFFRAIFRGIRAFRLATSAIYG